MDQFVEEVRFFRISEQALRTLQITEGYYSPMDQEEEELPDNHFQRRVWELMEYPETGLFARLLAVFSILVILVSITTFCIESMPEYHAQIYGKIYPDIKLIPGNTTASSNSSSSPAQNTEDEAASVVRVINIIEIVSITWFTIEYVVRFLSSPRKLKFVKSILNVIDLAAILPYFLIMLVDSKRGSPLAVISVARLVRVFRIFKLSRHSLGLKMLGSTLRASLNELGMLALFLGLSIVVFSSGIYYFEHETNGKVFDSIPTSFWYTLITMTTVGYGDHVPRTLCGRLIGTACAMSGVITLSLVVPVIATNFEFFYKRDRLNYVQDISQEEKKGLHKQGSRSSAD